MRDYSRNFAMTKSGNSGVLLLNLKRFRDSGQSMFIHALQADLYLKDYMKDWKAADQTAFQMIRDHAPEDAFEIPFDYNAHLKEQYFENLKQILPEGVGLMHMHVERQEKDRDDWGIIRYYRDITWRWLSFKTNYRNKFSPQIFIRNVSKVFDEQAIWDSTKESLSNLMLQEETIFSTPIPFLLQSFGV